MANDAALAAMEDASRQFSPDELEAELEEAKAEIVRLNEALTEKEADFKDLEETHARTETELDDTKERLDVVEEYIDRVRMVLDDFSNRTMGKD